MTQQYRMLADGEKVEKGDEYLVGGKWELSGNWKFDPRIQMVGHAYRRPVLAFFPAWMQAHAPSVPVHVVWAESPRGTPVVA